MMEDLKQLDYPVLKQRLRDSLQGRGGENQTLSSRDGELPFERPLAWWGAADENLRERITRAACELVGEVPDHGWAAESIEWLIAFLERAEIRRAVPELEEAARGRTWLGMKDGVRCHATALQALRSLDWKGLPHFWLEQPPEVGKAYPALIFGALADHGIGLAFDHLAGLAVNAETARRTTAVLPALVARKGLERVFDEFLRVRRMLHREAVIDLDEWFRRRNAVVPEPHDGWGPGSANGALLQECAFNWRPGEAA